MKHRRTIFFLRGVFLFLFCILLVAGFWFHSLFYQVGFFPLLLGGGFVVFLVILAMRAALGAEVIRIRKPKHSLVFSESEATQIIHGIKTMTASRVEEISPLSAGAYCLGRVGDEQGKPFAVVKILDSSRRLVEDVTEEEIARLGFSSKQDFLANLISPSISLGPESPITLHSIQLINEVKG